MLAIWKKLWPEIREYKKQFIFILLLGVLTDAFQVVIPELLGRLVNAWEIKDERLAYIIHPFFAVLWLFSSIARYYHSYLLKYTADRISLSQRRKLMNKYLSLNISFFQDFERGSGGLISRMLNDLAVILNGLHKVADMVRAPFMVTAMITYLLYLEWRLTLFVLIALPIVTFVMRKIAKSLRKHSHRNQEAMEDLTRTLKESLDGTKVVQSFLLEEEIRQKFNRQANHFLQTRTKIISREEAAGPIAETLTMIFVSFMLLYISHLVFSASFTTGQFLSFMTAIAMLQDSIRKLQDGYIKVQQAVVGLDRFNAIMETDSPLKSPAHPVPFPADWKEIEFRNVSFAYLNELVLKNVSVKIKRNEKIALVGSSGSGKSTLVNLLQRFFDPTSGQILLDGVAIDQFALHDLRKNIALVTQDVFLFNDSIQKNIQMGNLEAPLEKVIAAAKSANAEGFIQQTPEGYNTNVGDFGGRMSGGEKQRISIARAILKDAPILVLDEATSALDSESEQEVQKGLQSLLQGRTAFVIAHRLSTVASADRILVMKKGEIVEEGTHNQLVEKKGEYYKFSQMQNLD